MQAAIIQLALFSMGAVGLLIALIGFIALFSILRRVRISRNDAHIAIAPVTLAHTDRSTLKLGLSLVDTIEPSGLLHKSAVQPTPLPVLSRKVVSDHITIMIEPDKNPAPRRKAHRSQIQRIITHLQTTESPSLDIKAG